jgi:hypothetical protein
MNVQSRVQQQRQEQQRPVGAHASGRLQLWSSRYVRERGGGLALGKKHTL